MKKNLNRIVVLLFIIFLIISLSCNTSITDNKDNKKDDPKPADIEILGTWAVTGIDPMSGDTAVPGETGTSTLTNTSYLASFSGKGTYGDDNDDVTGTVLEYDNANDYFITKFITHYVNSMEGRYCKIYWVSTDATHIQFIAYTHEATFQDAKDSVTKQWGVNTPPIWTKQ